MQAGEKNDEPWPRRALEADVIRASCARAQRWREEAPVSVRAMRIVALGLRGMGLCVRLARASRSCVARSSQPLPRLLSCRSVSRSMCALRPM